jgi:ATP-dependent exoDNAse (exonuclease V) beta subunit
MAGDGVRDRGARQRALDPSRSFIVQAPAGSGKTELLTQRFLRLLAGVDHPEEILAITFTRKAAAEMRNRVLAALAQADGPRPTAAHHATTWELASAAAARDRALGWALRDTPGRLRVQTIDGLCAGLTRQLPLLSALGAPPATRPDAGELYLAAARRTVAALEEDLAAPLTTLLPHLDNDQERLVRLVAGLLGRREQWLRHLVANNTRAELEGALRRATEQHLASLRAALPAALTPELLQLAGFAAANLGPGAGDLAACQGLAEPPGAAVTDLPAWQALGDLLLKKASQPVLRAKVDARNGFPPPSSAKQDPERKALLQEAKTRFVALTDELAQHPDFLGLLHECRYLPPSAFTAAQWAVLEALREVLVRAAGELQLEFQERGEVDFTEVHGRAVLALGTDEEPTDLALALDYRLRHILVDEFQDTSSGQFELLQRLTAGWQPDDGRTLFAVGDPMQSIYGFREAEVGLYLDARARGIGALRLEPLTLEVNFRSQSGVVAWVNGAFQDILPARADAASGAVSYSPSVAFHPPTAQPPVRIHPFAERDDPAEAELVLQLIRETRAVMPHAGIAVLGRSRGHLTTIAQRLRRAGQGFQAVELEPLALHPAVQDLHALTRALLHPADRLAWLSILRAPWCGLQLTDLLAVAGEGLDVPVWPRLCDPAIRDALSTDGRRATDRLVSTLASALAGRRRRPLRQWVEASWIALGGPATLQDAAAQAAATAYLDLLEAESRAAELPDLALFEQALQRLYAPADPSADRQLQLMTMHKAKGLEFDVVILPGLGRPPRHDDPALLAWMERPAPGGVTDLLLAPIKSASAQDEPVYRYVQRLRAAKSRHEDGRLLYVAATRAKQQLHLIGHARADRRSGELRPAGNSLLGSLWPAVAEAFAGLPLPDQAPAAAAGPVLDSLRRLPPAWQPSALPRPVATPGTLPSVEPDSVPFDWAGQTARHVGTLVHRWLERIGNDGLDAWPVQRIDTLAPRLRVALANLGVAEHELDGAAARCREALVNTLQDPRGRWILQAHPEQRTEYPLTAVQDGQPRHYVIDRSFVDAEGRRWIVDYKTGAHGGSDTAAFLDQEQARYRTQLEGYAAVLSALEARPIRLGLYFPLLQGWREWTPDA